LYPPIDPYGDGYIAHLPVEISDDGMHAKTVATVDGPAGGRAGSLVEFFSSLCDDWQGWTGPRTWQAFDRELTIVAIHDGRGHVTLDVTLRRHHRSYDHDAWSARTAFTVEAGEQMSALARNIQDLFTSPTP
jgi:hypothetical protein